YRRKGASDRSPLALRPSSPRCVPLPGSAPDCWPTWRSGGTARKRTVRSSKRRATKAVVAALRPGPISTGGRSPTSSTPMVRACSRRSRLQNRGRIEIIVSAATHGYLPLLGRDESINAQIATGIASYRRHFGRGPRGIWLPECAYRPGYEWSRPVGPAMTWLRPGLEEVVGRHGLRYFFVDTHLVAGGAPIGTYEDRLGQRRLDAARDGTGLSPNEPYTVSAAGRRKVAILARDPRSSVQVWSADYGYPGDGAYLEFHRKHGMDGLRYWRVTDRRLALPEKV